MPAFGPTHADRELWGIVAFLREMPEMSPSGYRSLAGDGGEAHERENAHGEDEHSH